ncbi:hypothetical protein [Gracilibacillus oryzae]|nr:hypothetical protein [Gracilibacillus oryzae]
MFLEVFWLITDVGGSNMEIFYVFSLVVGATGLKLYSDHPRN